MRILHISHGGLPDPRIEKTALTMKDEGHELIFLGGRPIKYQDLQAFEKTFSLPVGNDLDVVISSSVKRKWLEAIRKLNPDIIHAHNPIVGHFLLGTDYPVIYDDHEYWSKQTFKYRERKMPRGLTSYPLMYTIPRWETKLLKRYPVITTTENTAKEHRTKAKWVGVTRNVPMLRQVKNLPEQDRKGMVYVGSDFKLQKFHPHRNMKGVTKYIKFDIISGETHRNMLEKLMAYEIGLTPWIVHPWHPYSDANRNYEYLHTGLEVFVNTTIKTMFQDDPYVHSFTNYPNLAASIDSLVLGNPKQIMEHAMKNYLWENQSKVIKEAYSRA